MIRLSASFAIDLPDDAFLMELMALPSARAAAVLADGAGRRSLVLVDRGAAVARPIDDALLPGAVDAAGRGNPVVLGRLGEGFVLLSPTGAVRWRAFGQEPQAFVRADPFPKNQHGFAVGVARGGVSDDADAALLFLHEPQLLDMTTRYALLRLDAQTGTARWEWVDAAGEPPALRKEDFPIPEYWRSSPSFDAIRPRIDHGAWTGGTLRLFVLGGLASFERWGMDYAIAATVRDGRAVEQWVCDEPSWGTFTSSGRYLILRPLRANGPSKGRPRLLDLGTNEVHAVQPARGLAGYVPVDHCDGTWWMTRREGRSCRIAACEAEAA